jgi:hypothetical protein
VCVAVEAATAEIAGCVLICAPVDTRVVHEEERITHECDRQLLRARARLDMDVPVTKCYKKSLKEGCCGVHAADAGANVSTKAGKQV